jgi:hypothetical protein
LDVDTESIIAFVIGIATALASSDICVNSSEATVQECIWSNELSQGISILPKQILYINPFITFPPPPSLIPFCSTSQCVSDLSNRKENDVIHALIEAELNPDDNRDRPIFEVNNTPSSLIHTIHLLRKR